MTRKIKPADKIKVTIKICEEQLNLITTSSSCYMVRKTEDEINKCLVQLHNKYPGTKDKQLMAMALYQFANWYLELSKKLETKDTTDLDKETNDREEFSNNDLDPLFIDAAKFIVKNKNASTSNLQRKYQIGYNRAGRIMEQLVEAGIVGASKGIKPRPVLMDVESLEKFLSSNKIEGK